MSTKKYVIRGIVFGYNDECFYVEGNRIKSTFGHRQIMYGIKDICFAATVLSHNAIEPLTKVRSRVFIVFEVLKGNGLKEHINLLKVLI